ncbi:unnamed protein product [Arabidopsis thaliana]|uniref:At5g49640 n=4 Tax=Arabidopsis TaxID=3701 RepID=Q9LT52_ARATH|nr:uncharacterized protein AT5G49640 [Arabidopsis thaliana]KAG7605504.1 hypothetical protein ISN45_At05g045070 [Arabidopsis thaliana x Arabidopsis arenosa]KAG7612426.1 hypothetical protein ISN44_As05g044420 [Arabidopsis suecica]ABL66734.1 At5g49640 [Arabidopsis thaliana]AED95839.1 hypothetical protein AT5G49640 [Arabidopsis thaliana]VYS69828.1 unnamed protein product [Arabidopsis thaliana]|eukprot:NP_199775.1 hypothetical protein AT5G49640 [Arabidopsis thaliana]
MTTCSKEKPTKPSYRNCERQIASGRPDKTQHQSLTNRNTDKEGKRLHPIPRNHEPLEPSHTIADGDKETG